jgi:hypothetical protein
MINQITQNIDRPSGYSGGGKRPFFQYPSSLLLTELVAKQVQDQRNVLLAGMFGNREIGYLRFYAVPPTEVLKIV